MTGPGLKPHQRCNPRSYVTGRDFRGWKTGLCQAHGGELRQWSRQDELSTTAAAILAFLSVFHGLRSGPEGCGVQMTLEGWSKLLGRSRRAVAYAFDQLDARGLVRRRRRLVKVDWVDDSGKARTRADVWGVAYLTKLGAVRIARRGETRRLMVRAGRSERVLVCAGVVGSLLKTHRDELRVMATRVTGRTEGTAPPPPRWRKTHHYNPSSVRAPVGPRCFHEPRVLPPQPRAALNAHRSRKASREGDRRSVELERLWSQKLLTAPTAWPDVWRTADARGRQWLREQFERDYRHELGRRLAAESQLGVDSERAARELAELAEQRRQRDLGV
jgi:hypothetical protein